LIVGGIIVGIRHVDARVHGIHNKFTGNARIVLGDDQTLAFSTKNGAMEIGVFESDLQFSG